jgi:hypothetical protein
MAPDLHAQCRFSEAGLCGEQVDALLPPADQVVERTDAGRNTH